MIMIALSSFLNTVVVHMYTRADKFCQVPRVFKVIFLDILAKVFCVIPKPDKKTKTSIPSSAIERDCVSPLIETRFKMYRDNTLLVSMNKKTTKTESDYYRSCLLKEIQYFMDLENSIKEIRDHLLDRRKKIEAQEAKAKIAMEWKYIALCLDRTFFFLFLIVGIITLAVIATKTLKHS